MPAQETIVGSTVVAQNEGKKERVDRELIELLNELRVALPGVQVLFAFLLAVPFSNGWTRVTAFQRDLFFATLMATAISTALLIAPSAYHRIHFRQPNKEQLLLTSNGLSIAGIVFLALAMVGAVVLVTDVLFSTAATIACAIAAVLVFGVLWAAVPLLRRR
jgi:Family of unknown function (DUF6328)